MRTCGDAHHQGIPDCSSVSLLSLVGDAKFARPPRPSSPDRCRVEAGLDVEASAEGSRFSPSAALWAAWHPAAPRPESGAVTTDVGVDPTDRGEAEYMSRAASAAEPDPVVVTVRVAGDAAPLAPRAATLVRQVDPGLQIRDVVTVEEITTRRQTPMIVSAVGLDVSLLWRWSSRPPD
jgi:hypothetical protein